MNHPSIQVKICGICRPKDAAVAVEAGADLIGINLWPGSKRFITFAKAKEWLPDFESQILRVAVLVRPEWDFVLQIVRSGCFDWVQLHGEESSEFANQVASLGLPLIYAVRIDEKNRDASGLDTLTCNHFLLDAGAGKDFGGSGRQIENAALRNALTRHRDRSCFVAGGLKPENVRAVAVLDGVDGVDVAGGVEVSPGIKSSSAIRDFVKFARGE